MGEDKKDAWDVFGGNNGYSPERIRGGFLKWARHYTNQDRDWQPTCKVDVGNFEDKWFKSQVAHFENWVCRHVHNWYDFRGDVIEFDELNDLMVEFYEENDEFRKLCGEFWELCYDDTEKDSVMLEDYTGGYKSSVDEFEDDEDVANTHRYPELNDVGLISDEMEVNYPKLRGTVISFVKSVDEIVGTEEEVNLNDLTSAWSRWMKDNFEDEWINFTLDQLDSTSMHKQVEYVWKNADGLQNLVEEKWTFDSGELEGNSGRDDSSKSRWEKFEERAAELDYEPPEETTEDRKPDLEKYEDVAVEKDTPDFEVNDVYCGDARDMLRDMRDANVTADALICDPPYGLDFESRGEGRSIEGDATVDEAMSLIEQIFKLSRLVLKDGAPVVVFCGDVNVGEVVLLVKEHFDYEQTLVWDKKVVGLGATGMDGSRAPRWRSKHEFAVYAGKGEMRFQNEKRHDGSILEFKKLQGDEMVHPTEKPQKLLRYIIEGVTDEGDLVVDPFAGSGSTLMAAKSTGRRYVGAELDEEFQEEIKKRLSQQVLAT